MFTTSMEIVFGCWLQGQSQGIKDEEERCVCVFVKCCACGVCFARGSLVGGNLKGKSVEGLFVGKEEEWKVGFVLYC